MHNFEDNGKGVREFLGDSSLDDYSSYKEWKKKLDFINKYLMIELGHWGDTWNVLNPPYASFMFFNSSFDKAFIEWMGQDCGGMSFWEKINGEWAFIKGGMEWTA